MRNRQAQCDKSQMQPLQQQPNSLRQRPTAADAIEIWIARWLRHKRSALRERYQCDPRRIYEIWEGKRFPESRELALKKFQERYPELTDRVDFSPHKRIPRSDNHPNQYDLFEEIAAS